MILSVYRVCAAAQVLVKLIVNAKYSAAHAVVRVLLQACCQPFLTGGSYPKSAPELVRARITAAKTGEGTGSTCTQYNEFPYTACTSY